MIAVWILGYVGVSILIGLSAGRFIHKGGRAAGQTRMGSRRGAGES